MSRSFEECDRADRAYYRALSPQARLEILFESNSRWPVNGDHEAPELWTISRKDPTQITESNQS